jgi:putative transposon-encoded protein
MYKYVLRDGFTRVIKYTDKSFVLKDNVERVYEKTITPYGTGAKIDAPKEHMGKRVYVVILKK